MYNFRIPPVYRRHREFFVQHQRGFGEDAFHAVWCFIFSQFKPKLCLEIGVYRGQTISLWSIIARELRVEASEIWGLSPLNQLGDDVSSYISIDYEQDIRKNFKTFSLGEPKLWKESSTTLAGVEFIKSKVWDLIYIDGSHNYEDVSRDFENALHSLKHGGLLCLDDSSLYLDYKPRPGRFAGHPGPSRLIKEFCNETIVHVMTVGHINVLQKI
jgi:hypothetical protein